MRWGDNTNYKPQHSFRLLTININGLPQLHNHPKYGTIREQINKFQVDIIGIAETNLQWNKFSTYDRLAQRTSKWWETTHCSYSYNINDTSTAKFQPGGTAILSRNLLAHKAQPRRTQDPTGLGRWTSTLYQGQQGKSLRIIQVYRPCKPNPNSANGTYQQHSRYLLSKHITTCPRLHILQDLTSFISHCQSLQEQVILMGDFNGDITSPPLSSFFQSLGLHNLLTSLFPDLTTAPPTYSRGHATIDGIFATQGVTAMQGGYLDTTLFTTDHTPIWVDLNLKSIFGSSPNIITPLNCRRLKIEDPRVVAKFNKDYHLLLQRHNLHSSLHHLMSTMQSPMTPAHSQEFERIDQLRIKCMLKAESKCRRLKTGNIDFSPVVQHQRDLYRFWSLILKRKQGKKIDTKYLSRWEKKLHLQHTFSTSISNIKLNIASAKSQYMHLKKHHSSLRDEWLEQLAAAKAQQGQKNSVSILHNLRQREKMRQAFRQIRWCLHHETITPPITEVTEIRNNLTIRHSQQSTVETAILNANNNKYRQTNDTPPMTSLYHLLGKYGITPTAQQILQGTFQPPPQLDQYTKALIKELAIPRHIRHLPKIDISFTPKDYCTGWSKMKEKTSSGISKIHFGHHLACSQHTPNATFEAQMSAIPYQTGYSPIRYQSSINAMLLKKAGKTDVDSLRTIVLLEPDFNFMNKKLGRDVMSHAEAHHLIAPEQFGSRKNHSSIDQVLIKTLYYDTLRIKRQDGYLCSNDAKACYDRITHSIASLSLQRVGLPIEPILSMFTTLQNMRHHIRTGYGISNISYGKTLRDGKPTQGSGQGNGASPCLWVMMSTPLLNMMRSANHGAKFTAPLSKEKIRFVGCSFVDDTDLVCTSFDSQTPLEDLTPLMQTAINTWEGGLRATGGALVPEKSWVYPIKHIWDNKGNSTLETPIHLDNHFTVNDHLQQEKPLHLISPSEAKETLGVYLAPNGSSLAQKTHLKERVLRWAEKIRTNHISHQNALLSIHTTILSTLKYPAPALSLSYQDWKEIMAPLHKAGLQAAGFCNKLPTAIRQGTTKNLGLHIPCMYLAQGIMKVGKYISHVTSKSILGQMIRLCEENTKLELGLPGNLYTIPYKKAHFLTTNSWIKHLWKFVYDHNIILQDNSPPLSPTTNTDRFLMDLFLRHSFRRRELIQLNKCRKYLRVTTVGDILIGDGTQVSKSIKQGQRSNFVIPNTHWPNQEDPGPLAWATWRRAIKQTIELNNSVLPHLQPTCWISSKHRSYSWYYHRGLDRLMQRTNNEKWLYYVRSTHRGRQSNRPIYRFRGTLHSKPSGSTPASVIPMNIQSFKFMGTLPLECHTPTPPPITSLQAFIQSLPSDQQSPLKDISHLDNIPHIVNSIKRGNCALVTDGSYFPSTNQAAAAFVLGNEAAHRRVTGRCHVIGHPSSYSSYRSELAGLHAGIMFLYGLCQAAPIHYGKITIACDNEGSLHRIAQRHTRTQEKHYDYISAINSIIDDMPITLEFTHVSGHKDRITSSENLTILECMNVSADTHARVKASVQPPIQLYSDSIIYKEWKPIMVTSANGQKIRLHSCLDKSLYDILTSTVSKHYWTKKMKIPATSSQTINWTSLGDAFSSLNNAKKKEVLKWNSGFCGTNHALKLRKQASSSECPGCRHPTETTSHIIQCKSQGATKTWDAALCKLDDWMKKHHAAPEIAAAIISHLHSWRNNEPLTPISYNLPHLDIAIRHQSSIGWRAFLHGYTSIHWEAAQSLYLQHKASRTSGKRWISALIKKLWETIWAMWRYRNGLVHEQTNSPLHKLTATLNLTIVKELQYGIDNLPRTYSYLFQKNMRSVLKTSLNQKKQWILSIWVARDTYTPNHFSTSQRHPLVESILLAWKHRITQYESNRNS